MAERPQTRQAGESAADAAITQLYTAHFRGLTRLAWLLVRDQGLAEDIVQEAFVDTHRRWDSIREPERATAYLRRSVVNGCRSAARHQGVVDRHLASEIGSADLPGRLTAKSAEDIAIGQDARREMIAAIERLPPRQREVVVLRYYADLSERQIADALGISPGAVKGYAHRAVNALRDDLEGR